MPFEQKTVPVSYVPAPQAILEGGEKLYLERELKAIQRAITGLQTAVTEIQTYLKTLP